MLSWQRARPPIGAMFTEPKIVAALRALESAEAALERLGVRHRALKDVRLAARELDEAAALLRSLLRTAE